MERILRSSSNALLAIPDAPQDAPDKTFANLERFTGLLYNRTIGLPEFNEARNELFVKRGREMEELSLTNDALQLHTKRAVYQGGHILA